MRMPTGFRAYPLDATGWVELVPLDTPDSGATCDNCHIAPPTVMEMVLGVTFHVCDDCAAISRSDEQAIGRPADHGADHETTMGQAQFDAANDRIDALCGKLSFTPEEAEEYFRLKSEVAGAICSQGMTDGKLGVDAPDHGRKGGEASTLGTMADGSATINVERLALCEVFSIDKRTGARQPFSVFEGNLAHLAREIDRAVDELGGDTWVSAERVWLDS